MKRIFLIGFLSSLFLYLFAFESNLQNDNQEIQKMDPPNRSSITTPLPGDEPPPPPPPPTNP